ncbi:MAG: nitrite reductase small subunit NirD [Cytophagaceae bacterium]|nr:nitrite reductase small subunit NirD [Cytophagaceae bacterium]MDW8455276.1 nitrite reductase small subunit NirD [Cytophagaceae bacterium]
MNEVLEQTKWIKACRTTDIPENGGAAVKIGNEQIAVFNFTRTGKWYATQNECPHKKQMILSRGMIGCADNIPKVACPFHKKTFSLENGTCLSGEDYTIKTFPIKIENGYVYISINDEV